MIADGPRVSFWVMKCFRIRLVMVVATSLHILKKSKKKKNNNTELNAFFFLRVNCRIYEFYLSEAAIKRLHEVLKNEVIKTHPLGK